jgi:hypothetical protein
MIHLRFGTLTLRSSGTAQKRRSPLAPRWTIAIFWEKVDEHRLSSQ